MSKTIIIGSEVIEFPSSAESPNWAPEIIRFAEAVEDVLNGLSGQFDVPPSTLNINAYNTISSGADIPNLSFSTTSVRGAFIRITVGRTTTTNSAFEITDIMVVYNPDNAPGTKWEISRSTLGDAKMLFTISDTGQISFTISDTLAGLNHVGVLTYTAQALKSTL